MKGLTLLKNIKRGNVKNNDKFIYLEKDNVLNHQSVCYYDGMLYFDNLITEPPVNSKELLNGEFISEAEYKMETKIMNWLEENMQVNNLFYFVQDLNNKNIINCYYKSDNTLFCELYKSRIASLIQYQEEVI